MDVSVGKKKFKLEKVSIYIGEMYSDLTQLVFDMQDLPTMIEESQLECDLAMEEAETRADKLRAKLAHSKAIRGIRDDAKRIQEEVFEKRFEILEELLKLNGYDFDRDLWEKNADTELVNDILVDLVGTGSKKKVT